ncbi:hypothetical protein BAE44_0022988 [Dichanthelium oligosanthes]|uniref:Uncharacterized protein n=1 Tax=Dichanthelium oligosanthes TaxID=888268 RepID=A0A1E5USZ9_9POAL|nr:hypothetical protein BAE44_0022988 [Dichanthelium oligosanthes]
MTLCDELRTDERHGRVPRAPNIRWKELLGLKKAPKKQQAAADTAAGMSTDAHTSRLHFFSFTQVPPVPSFLLNSAHNDKTMFGTE